MSEVASGSALPDWLRQRALISGDQPAVEFGADRLTFGQLDLRADCVASRLAGAGIDKADRVALLAGNGLDFALMFFGAARLGACLIPLNGRLSDDEIASQLTDCDPKLVVTDTPERLEAAGLDRRPLALAEATAPLDNPGAFSVQIEPGLPGCILYTSGTTGRPKGAILSHANFFWSALGSALQLGHQSGDRWLICLPMFHIGGLSILSRGVLNGITSVIHPDFDAGRVNRAIDAEGITLISVVSTMLQRMLAERCESPFAQTLRGVLLGGGPVSDDLTERCLRLGVPALQTYGLTETTSQVTTLRIEEIERKRGSAGRPLLPAELRIENEDGSVCPANQPGEIAIRGPMVSPGYFNLGPDSQDMAGDGWLHTGDFGYLDEDGYLFVIDRRDDLIVTGGENVYPSEVEAALEAHASVMEAGVFPQPDAEWGQAVAAAVQLDPVALVSPEQLQSFLRDKLAGFKVPKAIFIAAQLPRTASGKLRRNELRSLFASEEGNS